MKSKAEGFVFLVLDSSSSVPWLSSFFSIYFEEDQKFWNRSMTFAGFDIEPQATGQIHKNHWVFSPSGFDVIKCRTGNDEGDSWSRLKIHVYRGRQTELRKQTQTLHHQAGKHCAYCRAVGPDHDTYSCVS
jgi:hypothetical protein